MSNRRMHLTPRKYVALIPFVVKIHLHVVLTQLKNISHVLLRNVRKKALVTGQFIQNAVFASTVIKGVTSVIH